LDSGHYSYGVMAHLSEPSFRAFHALRIKGFAKVDMVADIAAVTPDEAEIYLNVLLERELAMFREQRGLWQLTPAGKETHREELRIDTPDSVRSGLTPAYTDFLVLNASFKDLCGDWQLKEGAPNDHSDTQYDKQVIERLVEMNKLASPIVETMGDVLGRIAPYAPRMLTSSQRVVAGENSMFTGVMCGSYHDVWMELHEDLILTQGIDRAAEGSF